MSECKGVKGVCKLSECKFNFFLWNPDFYYNKAPKPHSKLKQAQITLREKQLSYKLKLGGESDNPTSKGIPQPPLYGVRVSGGHYLAVGFHHSYSQSCSISPTILGRGLSGGFSLASSPVSISVLAGGWSSLFVCTALVRVHRRSLAGVFSLALVPVFISRRPQRPSSPRRLAHRY